MQVCRGQPSPSARRPCALTIGNFDGVHRGHQALIARVVAAAQPRGLISTLMTFEPHPREFFMPERAPARISNLRDKIQALRSTGVERTIVQHFDRRFASLSATAFIEDVLLKRCAVRWLLVGDDFRFGAQRAGDNQLLQLYADQGAFELEQMPTFDDNGERISSTAVRDALTRGDLAHARRLLGRPYAISGRVRHGRKIGRSLGFPTLNLRIARAAPALRGIFAVTVHGLAAQPVAGVASVGLRPTVDAAGQWTLEVHLFDFADEVYGTVVEVAFLHKLRDERKYDTLAELSAAIREDVRAARALFDGSSAILQTEVHSKSPRGPSPHA